MIPNLAAWPIFMSAMRCSGTVKSTFIVSSCCSVAITVPGWTYSPTSTRGMPMTPPKGASIAFRSSVALMRASVDSETASVASASSRAASELTPRVLSVRARSSCALSRASDASADTRSARSTASSICTSSWSSFDVFVGLEADRLHDARGLRGDVDALERPERADRLDLRVPGDRPDLGGGNGDGRHLLIGEEAGDHLVAEHVEADQPAANDDDGDHGNEGDEETLEHENGARSSAKRPGPGREAQANERPSPTMHVRLAGDAATPFYIDKRRWMPPEA